MAVSHNGLEKPPNSKTQEKNGRTYLGYKQVAIPSTPQVEGTGCEFEV